LKGCLHVDEIVPYATEQDLEDILRSFKLDVRIVGDEYRKKTSQDARTVRKKGLNCILMDGITVFQAVVCVKKLLTKKTIRVY
jgi:glycerol-3-phosphate cytidylyltransferase-like family protein